MEQRICKNCGQGFTVEDSDLRFYQKVNVSSPIHCPDCRAQRRLVWRNERTLYRRKCDLTGEWVISIFSPDAKYRVYAPSAWWGDKWNPTTYGRSFDFNRPFFEQFAELLGEVPLLAVFNTESLNSEFNQSVAWLKNCYMLAGANRNEECYYGNYVNDCLSCVDNLMISKCELSYECVECENSYSSAFLKNSSHCSFSWFLLNCIGCNDCFGCVNMRRKQFCFFNEQLTKEEYQNRLRALHLGTLSGLLEAAQRFKEHASKFPMKFMIGEKNENVSGNSIFHCKNTFYSFDVSHLEDCKYCSWFHEARDCFDCFAWGMPAELCYECMEVGDHAYRNLFTVSSQCCKNTEYSLHCMYSENLFGCVSIKRGNYIILNKPYSKEEFESLIPKIKEHMKKTGEYGELFPIPLSPFAYNETVAQEYFPMTKEETLTKGFRWKATDQKEYQKQTYQIPDDIKDIPDTITDEILACLDCKKNYKIVPQELKFYRQLSLPIPRKCPLCRHARRMKLRNPRRLFKRTCDKCRAEILTSYPLEGKEKVFCEKCYLESAY